MADLSTKSIRGAPPGAEILRGNMTDGDARPIRMLSDLGDRRKGRVYVVDSALAHHYCEVIRAAERVTEGSPATAAGGSEPESKPPEPAEVEDRAMKPPPRGRRK